MGWLDDAYDNYSWWYWTEGPGKGSGVGNVPAGASGRLINAPLPPAPTAPTVVEPAKPPPVEQTFTNWGKVIPISMGMRRISPMIIWLKKPVFIGVTPTADFCVSWGYNADDNPDDTVCTALYANGTRIWTIGDGNLLPGGWDWTWYPGTETQGKDPTMVADKGAANTPAYRNQMLGVFTNFPLEKFGFKLPGISAEIMGSGSEAPRKDSWNPADKHPAVVLASPLTITKQFIEGSQFAATSVRSRTFHRRGEYYMEITYDKEWMGPAWTGIFRGAGMGLGVSLATSDLSFTAGSREDSVGAATPIVSLGAEDGYRLWSGTYRVSGPAAWHEGQTIGFHINMNAGYARARNVTMGEAWTAPCYYVNPPKSADVAEIELGDPLYAHASVVFTVGTLGVSYSERQTVNFGAAPFLGAIPAGATAWNGTGGADVFLGTLPLKDFISKIAIYCGLNPAVDLDFVDIDDVIHGGIITTDTEFRSFLVVLGRAYGFDFYESNVIRLIRRVVAATYTVDKDIPPEDLLTDTDRAITTTRRKDDSPNEIELSYIDVTQQFRWNLQKARRILFPVKTTESQRKDAFSIPIVTTANDALTMAGKAMYREAAQNVDHECKLTSKHFGIEPSDILTITAADTEYTVKVAQVDIGEDMRITLRAVNLLTDEDMAFNAEAGEPALPWQGNIYRMGATEGADRATFSQFIGSLFAGEGADGFAGASRVLTLAATEGADRFTGAQFSASLAATDRPDAFSGSGGATGTLSATDRPDVFAGVGPPPVAPIVWNSADKSATVTLSNSDKTATLAASTGFRGVRGTGPKSSGKVHIEFRKTSSGGSWGFGLCKSTFAFTTEGLASPDSIVLTRDGDVWRNVTRLGGAVSAGILSSTWYAMEVDFDAKTVKFWNATAWSASFSFSAMTGPYYLLLSGNATNDNAEINTGQSAFTITPSSGFTAWTV